MQGWYLKFCMSSTTSKAQVWFCSFQEPGMKPRTSKIQGKHVLPMSYIDSLLVQFVHSKCSTFEVHSQNNFIRVVGESCFILLFCFLSYCQLCWGLTSGSKLRNHSWQGGETIWGVGNWVQIRWMHSKYCTHCTISLAPNIILLLMDGWLSSNLCTLYLISGFWDHTRQCAGVIPGSMPISHSQKFLWNYAVSTRKPRAWRDSTAGKVLSCTWPTQVWSLVQHMVCSEQYQE